MNLPGWVPESRVIWTWETLLVKTEVIMSERHRVEISDSWPDGSDTYECPTCGRRFTLHPYNGQKVVHCAGDETAIHYYEATSISIDADITDYLAPFRKWAEENGL